MVRRHGANMISDCDGKVNISDLFFSPYLSSIVIWMVKTMF